MELVVLFVGGYVLGLLPWFVIACRQRRRKRTDRETPTTGGYGVRPDQPAKPYPPRPTPPTTSGVVPPQERR